METTCNRCVLPDTYPGIAFDKSGICTLCRTHRQPEVRGRDRLDEVIQPLLNRGKYDCIVALSGGRDSTFALHYSVKELGLTPLVFTFANGYLPERTRMNIEQAVEKLEVDHILVEDDSMRKATPHILAAWMRRPSAAMIPLLCSGCQTGFKRNLGKVAEQHGIRLVISGGGEPETSFAEAAMRISNRGLLGRYAGLSMLLGALLRIAVNPFYLSPGCFKSLYREYLYRFHLRKKCYKYLQLFRYVEWDEDLILNTIRGELGWESPSYCATSWRADCDIHLLKQHLYKHTLGFTKNHELLGNMIREGKIGREAALVRLEHDDRIPAEFLDRFLGELDISPAALSEALDAAGSRR